MSEQTIQLDIPLILPDIVDARDDCLTKLNQMLENHRGIQRVHVNYDADPPQLCLHFDPNLISLATVERMARDAGSSFTNRYRHEAMPFTGMTSADAAKSLAALLGDLPGMLHASVNYAAGFAFVAYDITILQRPLIHKTLQRMGYRPLRPMIQPDGDTSEPQEKEDHDHGSAPTFLPHWMQER